MDKRKNLGKESIENIEMRLDVTRKSLRRNVVDLESSIRKSLSNARNSAQSSYSRLRQTFNLEHQVQVHPWSTLAVAVGVGLVTQRVLSRPARNENTSQNQTPSSRQFALGPENLAPRHEIEAERGFLSAIANGLEDELKQLKAIAVTTLLGGFRKLLQSSVNTFTSSNERGDSYQPEIHEVDSQEWDRRLPH